LQKYVKLYKYALKILRGVCVVKTKDKLIEVWK